MTSKPVKKTISKSHGYRATIGNGQIISRIGSTHRKLPGRLIRGPQAATQQTSRGLQLPPALLGGYQPPAFIFLPVHLRTKTEFTPQKKTKHSSVHVRSPLMFGRKHCFLHEHLYWPVHRPVCNNCFAVLDLPFSPSSVLSVLKQTSLNGRPSCRWHQLRSVAAIPAMQMLI